jgi:hypothetical protein
MTTEQIEQHKKAGRKLIPASPDLDDSELEAIKVVKSYESHQTKVALFEGEHSEVFQTYDGLLGELERKRQVADATIRAIDASFGSWERYSEQRKYDTTALYDLIGKPKFLALGGTVTEMPVIEIAKDKLELAIQKKDIPKSVVSAILKITPMYRAPKPRSRT